MRMGVIMLVLGSPVCLKMPFIYAGLLVLENSKTYWIDPLFEAVIDWKPFDFFEFVLTYAMWSYYSNLSISVYICSGVFVILSLDFDFS